VWGDQECRDERQRRGSEEVAALCKNACAAKIERKQGALVGQEAAGVFDGDAGEQCAGRPGEQGGADWTPAECEEGGSCGEEGG